MTITRQPKVKSAEAVVKHELSFALKEQESGIMLDSALKRAQAAVYTHIHQSTDIILVTSNNREGKSTFIDQLSKDINDEIRSITLHSEDLLSAANESSQTDDIDFSLISSIIYESIQLDEYLLISINDADKLPIKSFNELVTLALNTNSKKNNIIFLFAGGPDLLSQIEQISNIRRLSIAHCTLDELAYEDLLEFISIRQENIPSDQQYIFDEQALRTIVTHASGSLFKAAVLLEWCREYANFNQDLNITSGKVSQLLSILLSKSQVEGVNLFASYPVANYDFNAPSEKGSNHNSEKISTQSTTSSTNKHSDSAKQQSVSIKVISDKIYTAKPNVYERVMADASEEELISEAKPARKDSTAEISYDDVINAAHDAKEENEIEHIVVEENQTVTKNVATELAETNHSANKQEPSVDPDKLEQVYEDSKPLYIENTDLSLTKLVPKHNTGLKSLSSLQWTFIILIIGAILFYGGIMFIASNGNPQISTNFLTEETEEILIEAPASLPAEVVETKASIIEEAEEVIAIENIAVSDEGTEVTPDHSKPQTSILQRLKTHLWPANDKDTTVETLPADEPFISPEEQPNTAAQISETQKENTIQALLDLAEVQLENNQLTSPASGNALDTYRMVLSLDPDNETAKSGLEAIRVRYLIWAEKEAVAGNSEQAKLYLEKAVEMAP